MFPETSQYAAVNSSVNITFTCNVAVPDGNPMDTSAVWDINNRQINVVDVPAFETFGIFIEVLNQTNISITITREAREAFQGSLRLVCAASIPGPPSIITFSPVLNVGTYGMCSAGSSVLIRT